MFYLSKKELRFLKDAIDPDRAERISSLGYVRLIVWDGSTYFYTLDGYRIHAVVTNYSVPSQYENFLYRLTKDGVEPAWENPHNQSRPWESFPKTEKRALVDTTKYRETVRKYAGMFDGIAISDFVDLVNSEQDYTINLPSKEACRSLAKSDYIAVIKDRKEVQFFPRLSEDIEWKNKDNFWIMDPRYLREAVVGNSKISSAWNNKIYMILNDVGFALISGFGK